MIYFTFLVTIYLVKRLTRLVYDRNCEDNEQLQIIYSVEKGAIGPERAVSQTDIDIAKLKEELDKLEIPVAGELKVCRSVKKIS